MHKYNCFIRKNTFEIIQKLEGIEWRHQSFLSDDKDNNFIGCFKRDKELIDSFDNWKYLSKEFSDRYLLNRTDIIDCGDNEDLFFAIAAIRNNTDKNQFFVLNKDYNTGMINFSKGIFSRCNRDKWLMKDSQKSGVLTVVPAHKASAYELIEYFKK